MNKFEAGKSYYTITISGNLRVFEVIEIIQNKNNKLLKGRFDGRKEKIYVIENRWLCMADKENKKPPIEAVEVDKRYKLIVFSDMIYNKEK